MDGRTAAAILGVSPGASKGEVTRAFRARAKATHPDGAGATTGTGDDFIAVRAAYELLCRPTGDLRAIVGSRRGDWFRSVPTATLDLRDLPGPRTPLQPRPAPPTRPARSTQAARPTRPTRPTQPLTDPSTGGRRFEDHLVAQLARSDGR